MWWLIHTRPPPPTTHTPAPVPSVAVSTVDARTEQIPVVGYGAVRPKNQVQIVPQISGKLVYTHENLAQGEIIPSGELLFEIDSTVYEARTRQVQAEVRGLEGALVRHDQEMENLKERIANAEQMLAIDESDYYTSKRLFEAESVGTQRDVDLVRQKYLQQRDVVVSLKNQLALIPHLKLETQAKLDASLARLRLAQHNLDHTKINCPFKARVESTSAYRSQVVSAHFSIATLTDMEAFEIAVGVDPRDLRWLAKEIQPAALKEDDHPDGPKVTVIWSLPGQQFTWDGYATRFERVDEVTRTAHIVVEVREADMVAQVALGSTESAPSLSIGMYCRTELPAEPLDEALLVPRHAIYDGGWVYVFEPDVDSSDESLGRLGRRRVPKLRAIADSVLVDYSGSDAAEECELKAGDKLVVSPLAKPTLGMRIAQRKESLAAATAVPLVEPADFARVVRGHIATTPVGPFAAIIAGR